jgi:hypothetical protein
MKKFSWGNLTLGQYADFEITRKQVCILPVDLLEKDCKLISLLTKIPLAELEAMPMSEFNEYRKQMYEFVAIELKGKFMAKFKLAHRKFVFDSSNNNIKVSNLTDLSLLKITGENLAEQLPTIVSIFCKEKKVWYMPFRKPLEFQERMKLFKDKLNLEVGFGVAVFFCKVSEELPNLIQNYLETEMMKVDNLLEEARMMITEIKKEE